MAGTAPILVYGFGVWGGVELVPTLGYGCWKVSAAIDYRCHSTRPFYKADSTRPHYKASHTRPHYASEAQDKWS